MKKGQALLFVFFLLLIVSILIGALAVMWKTEIKTRSSERDGLIAFYLAQAGIERAKIEVLNNVNFLGNAPAWYNDLDIAGDNYTFRYNCSVTISGTQRTIIGRGEVLDGAGNNLFAHREIQLTIDGICDNNCDPGTPNECDADCDLVDDNPPNNSVTAWSWREI